MRRDVRAVCEVSEEVVKSVDALPYV